MLFIGIRTGMEHVCAKNKRRLGELTYRNFPSRRRERGGTGVFAVYPAQALPGDRLHAQPGGSVGL